MFCSCSCTYLRTFEWRELFFTFSTPQTFCILLIITRKTTLLTVFCYFRTCSAAQHRRTTKKKKNTIRIFTEIFLCRWKKLKSPQKLWKIYSETCEKCPQAVWITESFQVSLKNTGSFELCVFSVCFSSASNVQSKFLKIENLLKILKIQKNTLKIKY